MSATVRDRPVTTAPASGAARAGVAARVPVVVVTGYLGSGKTTLISGLLSRPGMAGTAVIVNELAEAGIDQSIIGDAGADDVVLLSNGCLCCAAGSDLRNAVARLLRHPDGGSDAVQRILIETSGAADPGPILKQICFDPALRAKVRYGGVLTLFDVQNGEALLARDPVGLRQIGLADRLLLTKTDLAGPDGSRAARALLGLLNPNAPIIGTAEDVGDFIATAGQGISAAGLADWLGETSPGDPASNHDEALSTWTVFSDSPVSWDMFEQRMRQAFDRHGDDVLRTKGIVWTKGDDRPLVIHGICRHFHRPVRLSAWDSVPRSRFVVIGFQGAAIVAGDIAGALGGTVCAPGHGGPHSGPHGGPHGGRSHGS